RRNGHVWRMECSVNGRIVYKSTGTRDKATARTMLAQWLCQLPEREPAGNPRIWRMEYEFNGQRFCESTGTSDEGEARAILADHVRELRIEQESPYLFVKASPRGGHFHRRRGAPLLTRTIYHVIREKVSPVACRPVHPHLLRLS